MYAEFYNISDGKGITFKIDGVSLCGLTLRLKIKHSEFSSEWYFVSTTDD
jgi:hypothetical protein